MKYLFIFDGENGHLLVTYGTRRIPSIVVILNYKY